MLAYIFGLMEEDQALNPHENIEMRKDVARMCRCLIFMSNLSRDFRIPYNNNDGTVQEKFPEECRIIMSNPNAYFKRNKVVNSSTDWVRHFDPLFLFLA